MIKRLLPDPPLQSLPELPDDLRWRIASPNASSSRFTYGDTRRVYLEKRVEKKTLFGTKARWVIVYWAVWKVEQGLGDFTKANPTEWYYTKGLANTVGYIFKEVYKTREPRYLDVHGVSKF